MSGPPFLIGKLVKYRFVIQMWGLGPVPEGSRDIRNPSFSKMMNFAS
jgi:hypothetical protein